MFKEIKNENHELKELVVIFRLLFEGKTDTLISMSNQNYSFLSNDIKTSLAVFKDTYLDNFPCELSKTGGWVTSFLDYSISYMERVKYIKNQSVDAQFKFYFP